MVWIAFSMPSRVNPLQRVFANARREFQNDLPAGTNFRDILAATSIEQVYTVIKTLQAAQGKKRFFVQVKPDILALLLWGPVKLILLWTSEWRQGHDAIIKTIERIGELLPRFGELATQFVDQKRIKDIFALFYRDILDFYREIISFFALPRHRKLFDIVWPKRRDRIKIVEGNIEKHARLIGENITSEHIRRQEEARVKSFEEFREAEEHRAEQRFQALKTSVRPQSYNQKLDFLKRQICPGIAEWLVKDKTFLDWVNIGSQSTTRSLWLQGIPGAGKTFLASWVVTRVKGAPGRAIYAFLSHTFVDTTTISIIHSLLFQLASGDEDIQAMLLHPDKREFVSDTAVAKALLADALKCAGNTFLIVDGLDEVEELERRGFLSSVMEILDSHPGLRLCISSRAEDEQTIHENLLVGKTPSFSSPASTTVMT
ncbi:hypothetical protein QBC37DRAFT_476824 [Rhypophila decipiens]|uniref:NACHT domain-containing protein n=1 Tax=Rhypophila decipiens TaxID=261697 RepID=A0AAN6XW15_9PEZI|nr:hypothetical protein QBC37DRAFT_476824 [Rhypophila decipiens]